MSTASTATLSTAIEPATRKFLESLNSGGGKQIYELSVEEARKLLSDVQSGTVVEKLPADIEDKTIPVGPSGQVSIRIVRPKGVTEALPAIVYFHGGGWVLGGTDTHDRLIRELANGAKAAVVFVNFTLAPDAKYPTQIEEAYAATKYVAENAKALNLKASELVVAGDSVGGNMVAAVTLLAKERGGPSIAYQVLFYPVTDANFETQSYRDYAQKHFLTREAMKWFWGHYTADEAVRKEPTASPLRASLDQLKGLPPALVITGEFDVLRDEGEAYAHKLSEAGVTVKAVRLLGTIHDFVLLNVITNTPAPRTAIALATATLQELFLAQTTK